MEQIKLPIFIFAIGKSPIEIHYNVKDAELNMDPSDLWENQPYFI